LGRLGRSKIFSGQVGRQICVVRNVRKFWRLGRSEYLGGREVWKDWEGATFGRIHSPIINAFLQLRIYCVSYHSDDYRTALLLFFLLFKYILM
jgi:hypothetical protein